MSSWLNEDLCEGGYQGTIALRELRQGCAQHDVSDPAPGVTPEASHVPTVTNSNN